MGEVLAVLSGKGGTGKTSVCAGLACALAEAGRKVLSVDCDVGLRNLDISLGLTEGAALSFLDVAGGNYPLSSAARHPKYPDLCFLTAPMNCPVERIDIESFRAMLRQARREFDLILLDAPAGVDAGFRLVSSAADRFLLVTGFGPASDRDAARVGELLELLRYRYEQIDFIDEPVDLGFDCPLDLHCTYTRDQLLVALDFMNPNSVREGVKWLPDKQVDVLFVTLNKSDKEYSPTTMYNDYSINEELFHWQSQSTTTDTGSVGQRYIHHRERGSKVLLFVREFKSDLVGAAPYTFLGMANYVKHTGSRPMNITWKLDHPIPAKYLKKTQKLVVG